MQVGIRCAFWQVSPGLLPAVFTIKLSVKTPQALFPLVHGGGHTTNGIGVLSQDYKPRRVQQWCAQAPSGKRCANLTVHLVAAEGQLKNKCSLVSSMSITLFKKLIPSSQHISSIQFIIQQKPSKELDFLNTFGLPNPSDSSGRMQGGKVVLIELAGRIRLAPPDEVPAIILLGRNMQQYGVIIL